MTQIDRFLSAALVAGIWTVIALQLIANNQTSAQETPAIEQHHSGYETQIEDGVMNASEIVGLKALVEKVVRESQLRPQSISGLDQYIRTVVRGCKVSGGITGDRISYATISC